MNDFENLVLTTKSTIAGMARKLLRGQGGDASVSTLVQAGLVGLWQASLRRDPSREKSFKTYALKRARGAMLDELRLMGPRKRLAQAAWEDDSWMSRTPWALLAECSLEDADGVLDACDPEQECQRSETASLVRKLLRRLPRRHLHVVKRYYFEEAGLAEVSAELGVTEARASQLVSESLLLMREALTTAETEELSLAGGGAPKKIMRGRGQSRARLFTHGGKSQGLSAWARELGVSVGTLQSRLYKKWSLADTLETPVGPDRRGRRAEKPSSRTPRPSPPQEPHEEGSREKTEEPVRAEA